MSIIGTLETLPLPLLLRRIEAFTKTGLMTITQGAQSVELYFRNGKLMCVGPLHTDITLAERLAQDGMISSQVLKEVEQMAEISSSETHAALTLMEMGYVKREDLRAWMTQKVIEVLRVLLAWKSGSIAFAEDGGVPAERLLVSLSISSLLDTLDASPLAQTIDVEPEAFPDMETQVMPAAHLPSQFVSKHALSIHSTPASLPALSLSQPTRSVELAHSVQPVQSTPSDPASAVTLAKPDVSQVTTLFGSSQFFARPTESPLPLSATALRSSLPVPEVSPITHGSDVPNTTIPASSLFDVEILLSTLDVTPKTGPDLRGQMMSSSAMSLSMVPYTMPRSVNTSFMRPYMVMVSVAFTSSGEQYVPITPEQWQLLPWVDGQTTLEEVCERTRLSMDQVYQAAGELIEEKIIQVVPPQRSIMNATWEGRSWSSSVEQPYVSV